MTADPDGFAGYHGCPSAPCTGTLAATCKAAGDCATLVLLDRPGYSRPDRVSPPEGEPGPTWEERPDVEAIARRFHDTYERLAVDHGWVTQERSRVAWEVLPPSNRALMIATVMDLMTWLPAQPERITPPDGVTVIGWTDPTDDEPRSYPVVYGKDVPAEGWDRRHLSTNRREWLTPKVRGIQPYGPYVIRPIPEPPAPETERVPWYRAMGRRHVSGDLLGDIVHAAPTAGPAGMYVEYHLPELGTSCNPVRDPVTGTVEVLIEREGHR